MIVSTYESPSALALALDSLRDQSYRDFEVVVADDGSGPATRDLIESKRAAGGLSLRHVWHEDRGFRLAAIRNRAISTLETPYVVFLDGDCVVRPNYLARHARLAEKGWFVRGSRMYLRRELTESVLRSDRGIHRWSTMQWFGVVRRGGADRVNPMFSLPLGIFRKLAARRWARSSGCNLAVWREDIVALNGFDERYEGWGYEDTDFVARLINHGVRRKDGRFSVPVIHLWHPKQDHVEENRRRFESVVESGRTRAERGLDQYREEVVAAAT